jgi:hypothetical protein
VTVQALQEGDLPALYRAANATSLAEQNRLLLATKVRLGSLLAAAACGVFVGLSDPPDWVALVGVIAFLVAVGAELLLLFLRPERGWYEGRAASESVKTLAWRYAVCGQPFGKSEKDVDARFLARLREILTNLHDVSLQPGPEGGEQLPKVMRELRSEPLEERRNAYRIGRLEDQRDWYAHKSNWNDERARRFRILAVVLEMLGVVAGIMTVLGVVKVDVLGVIAAAIAGVAAWMQTKQYETLARAYSVANEELAALRSEWRVDRTEEEWARFVDEAEEAISREHTLWRASRGVAASWERK